MPNKTDEFAALESSQSQGLPTSTVCAWCEQLFSCKTLNWACGTRSRTITSYTVPGKTLTIRLSIFRIEYSVHIRSTETSSKLLNRTGSAKNAERRPSYHCAPDSPGALAYTLNPGERLGPQTRASCRVQRCCRRRRR